MLFSTAVQRLVEAGHDIFLEISPHPILLSAMQQGFHHFGQEAAVLPSLRREEDERTVLLGSLGALYTLGYTIDWNLIYPAGGRCVRLPFYPWQRERCWLEPSAGDTASLRAPVSRSGDREPSSSGPAFQTGASCRNPLLGNPRWTRIPCLIWMTTASKASPCCPPRPMWRWPWPPRSRSSERNPLR